MRILLCAAVALLSVGTQVEASSKAYPSRPITLIVPFAAGGPTDTIALVLAEAMGKFLGQPVVPENVTGAAGTIAVGSDADIAIWDPEREVTISQPLMHGGCDYTPYEGIVVKGWPVSTMVRGAFVVRDGELVGKPGAGLYVARDKSPLAAPSGHSAWE